MAAINTGMQLNTGIIMLVILLGNLMSGFKRGRCTRLFSMMLVFDILMLFAGGIDNLLLSCMYVRYSSGLMHAVLSGISDLSYFYVLGLFVLYIDLYDREESRRIDAIAWVGAVTSFIYGILWFLSDFFGIIYTMDSEGIVQGPLYSVGQLGGYVSGAVSIMILFARWNSFNHSERVGFTAFILIPFTGSFFKGLASGINIMPLLVTLSLVIIQAYVQGLRELHYVNQQAELAKLNTDLLMSRLKPHFINNVLNSIYALCDISAEQTKEAIAMLSRYLRGSLINMESDRLIFFEEELEHTENYLSIERLRFGDQLEVIYDIREKDFLIPALTLQTIVENAVRHGVEKKPGYGRITIKTASEKKGYTVTVTDTGAGFDAGAKDYLSGIVSDESGRKHVGLYSAAYRVKKLCDGSLTVRSTPGEGTTVIIKLGGAKP